MMPFFVNKLKNVSWLHFDQLFNTFFIISRNKLKKTHGNYFLNLPCSLFKVHQVAPYCTTVSNSTSNNNSRLNSNSTSNRNSTYNNNSIWNSNSTSNNSLTLKLRS